MTIALVYLRYSPRPETGEPVESLDNQLDAVHRYASMHCLGIGQVFAEPNVSGAMPLSERPEGSRMMALLEKERHPVVCQKLDRIFRDTADGLQTIRAWDRLGVQLHLADQGGVSMNTSTATGRMFLTVLLGFAAFERDLIGERTSDAMKRKVANGDRVGAQPPLGRMVDPDDPSRTVENPDEQAIIEEVMQLKHSGCSNRRIAKLLNRNGRLRHRGPVWTHQAVSRMVKWHERTQGISQ